MRANLSTVIEAIQPGAVASFNILDLDMARAVIETAEALSLPAIIGIASRHYEAIRAPQLIPSLHGMIDECDQPIALHLDHASPAQLEMIREALDLGFTSIMIDGSHLPFDDNVEVTAKVVDWARAYQAGVEGELGAVAGEEGVADTGQDSAQVMPYTDPDEAFHFVKQTNVNALAIALGTAHGIYSEAPHIHYETIINIAKGCPVPLVMHGATGVSDEAIRQSVGFGIRKINYFSGLLQGAMDEVRASAGHKDNDYLGLKSRMAARWGELMREQMTLYAGNKKN